MADTKTYEMMLKIAGKVDTSLPKTCKTAAANLDALGKTAKNAAKVAAGAVLGVTAAVGTVGVAAINAGAEYEAQLANVSTLLTGTEAEIKARTAAIGQEILGVSNVTGVANADLTDGMYQVISAFGDSADAAKILETAAKGAAAGNATTTDSINLLSAVTKGYGDVSAGTVEKASDLAFTTVRLGQTSFPELAASMGKVIPLASTLGVEQEQLFGAMATLTGVTGGTAEVTTQLKATMQAFLSPSKEMAAALSSVGYESGQALLEGEGLQGALEILKNSVGGNELAFAGLFSSVEAQTAALAMAGAQAGDLTAKTAEMYSATGAANAAFDKQTDSLKYTIQEVKNLGANFLTQMGTNILPYVRDFAEAALPKVQAMLETVGGYVVNTIIPAAQTAVTWIVENKDVLLALAAGIATAVVAYKAYTIGVTAYNAIMGVYQVVTAASATGTFTLAGAMAALNLPVYAVIAAIALLVAAGVWLYQNWDMVKAKALELGIKINEIWTNISGFISGAIDTIGQYFPLLGGYLDGVWGSVQAVWENIKGIFSGIIDFISNVFAGNWSGAWDSIVSIFGNIFGAIGNFALMPINGVIGLLNGAIGAINSLKVDIPDWVPGIGGQTFGFSIPTIPTLSIPALAEGGIVTSATVAMVGEGSEPEAVTPISKLAGMIDGMIKPQQKAGGGGGGDNITFAPVMNFYGNADKDAVEEATRNAFEEFKRLYKKMQQEERRKKFAMA